MRSVPGTAALSAILVAGALALASAQRLPLLPSEEPLAIVGAHLVDVRRGTLVPNVTFVVRAGRIESIGPQPPPSGIRVLNLTDHYLVPGLVDAHAHITDFESGRRALESGVTTARSAGVSAYADVGLRDLSTTAALVVPEILAAGYGLRPQLPLDAFLASPAFSDLEDGVRGPIKMQRAVRMNTLRKVDWIKLFVTEGVAGDPSRMQFTEADLVTAVQEATASGIPVEAHAFGDEGARAAINAGARSIEHGSYMSEATLTLMKERNVFFVPTLRILTDVPATAPPAVRSRMIETLPAARRTIQQARKLGVRIVTGTDSNYGPTANRFVSHEMLELENVGLTPVEVIRSATVTAAEMLKLERSIGVLETGYQADLVAVRGNPLEKVAALQTPVLVLSNGRIAFLNSTLLQRARLRQVSPENVAAQARRQCLQLTVSLHEQRKAQLFDDSQTAPTCRW